MFMFMQKQYPEILELYTCKVCEIFVYKHNETIEYVKN